MISGCNMYMRNTYMVCHYYFIYFRFILFYYFKLDDSIRMIILPTYCFILFFIYTFEKSFMMYLSIQINFQFNSIMKKKELSYHLLYYY